MFQFGSSYHRLGLDRIDDTPVEYLIYIYKVRFIGYEKDVRCRNAKPKLPCEWRTWEVSNLYQCSNPLLPLLVEMNTNEKMRIGYLLRRTECCVIWTKEVNKLDV